MVNGRPSRCFQMAIAALAAALLPCAVASVAAGEPGTLEVREVCAGDRPWVSPDGKVLAVVRGEDDPEDVDAHGRAARVSRVWFRDLATGDETKAEVTGLQDRSQRAVVQKPGGPTFLARCQRFHGRLPVTQ